MIRRKPVVTWLLRINLAFGTFDLIRFIFVRYILWLLYFILSLLTFLWYHQKTTK